MCHGYIICYLGIEKIFFKCHNQLDRLVCFHSMISIITVLMRLLVGNQQKRATVLTSVIKRRSQNYFGPSKIEILALRLTYTRHTVKPCLCDIASHHREGHAVSSMREISLKTFNFFQEELVFQRTKVQQTKHT